jgi:glycosyltransferase involved in cell wall biosynthesis
LHLLAILENLPEGVQPSVALPESPPEWFPAVPFQILKTPIQDQFSWEQSGLPRLTRRLDAQLLHLFSASAPLLGRSLAVVSPSGFNPIDLPDPNHGERNGGVRGRLRRSIRLGGLARAHAIFWPKDLPIDTQLAAFQRLPPCVYSGFTPDGLPASGRWQNGFARAWNELRQLDLPETYLLYHGPASTSAIDYLLNAWRWAAGPIGDYHPLLVLGFNAAERGNLTKMAESFNFGETIRALPELSPLAVALLYQGSTALFHPAPEPVWGGPIRHALACGKPIVASQHPQTNRLVGPAAYLAPGDDSRLLGAALITVVVEEEVASKLAQAARQRAAAWTGLAYSHALFAVYQKILES